MSWILGDYIGFKESLEDEFKEFMFKITPEFYFSNQQVYDYVKTGVLDNRIFNDFVLENLEQYLQIYLPKYISAFGNSEEVEDGYLYLGVNDSGELTGIPFLGSINQEHIKQILFSIKQWVGVDNDPENKFRDELIQNVSFDLIPLEVNMDLLEDDEEELLRLEQRYANFIKEIENYKIQHAKWLEEIQSFTTKISYIMLDKTMRKEIADYIRTNCKEERFWIAGLLESDKKIEILNGIQLSDYKNCDNNVYYWIMFYKDYIVNNIRKKKPIKPTNTYGSLSHIYLDYFRGLTKLRKKFILNNPSLTYTILRFRIPGKKYKDDKTIFYNQPDFVEKWYHKIRTIGLRGPCCI